MVDVLVTAGVVPVATLDVAATVAALVAADVVAELVDVGVHGVIFDNTTDPAIRTPAKPRIAMRIFTPNGICRTKYTAGELPLHCRVASSYELA